jgi:hypothetical protein
LRNRVPAPSVKSCFAGKFLAETFNCLIWCFLTTDIAYKFKINMARIQEMLVGDVKEETEEKIDIENAISSSDHMPK